MTTTRERQINSSAFGERHPFSRLAFPIRPELVAFTKEDIASPDLTRAREIPSDLFPPNSPDYNPYFNRYIPLAQINVLTQMRHIFNKERLRALESNIGEHKLLSPIIVAKYSRYEGERYLKTLNWIWSKGHSLEELKCVVDEEGEEYYYILVGGERRLRSHKELGRVWIEVRLDINPQPLEAIKRQFSENSYIVPTPYERANALSRLWSLAKQLDPKGTKESFCKGVGITAPTLNQYIAYCDLPFAIQEHVENDEINFGIALEIHKLLKEASFLRQQSKIEADIAPEDLDRLIEQAKHEKLSKAKFSQLTRNFIIGLQHCQDMLALFEAIGVEERRKEYYREVVGKEFVRGVWHASDYFALLKRLLDENKVGIRALFSEESPRRIIRTFLDRQRALLPHFQTLRLRAAERKEAEKIIDEIEASLDIYERQQPTVIYSA